MSSTKFILGLFEDPDEMMHGIDCTAKKQCSYLRRVHSNAYTWY
jgi:hypothetical protein